VSAYATSAADIIRSVMNILAAHNRREFLRGAGELAIGGVASTAMARQVPKQPAPARRRDRGGALSRNAAPFYLRILQNEKLISLESTIRTLASLQIAPSAVEAHPTPTTGR
jgi:hypothetical protein